MATYTGQDGVITIGSNTAAEVTAFSIDHTTNTIEKTSMGDVYREYFAGLNEWAGSADIYIASEDATLWANCIPGSSATTASSAYALTAYPSGNATTNPKLVGNIIVTGFSVSSELEGMVSGSISFQGTGPLTMSQVS